MFESPILLLLFGVAIMIGLIGLHFPVGVSMAVTGLVMFALQVDIQAAFGTISAEVVAAFTSRDLVTIPLFLLMGSLAARAGIASDIYNLASAWIGHLRGGLAMPAIRKVSHLYNTVAAEIVGRKLKGNAPYTSPHP